MEVHVVTMTGIGGSRVAAMPLSLRTISTVKNRMRCSPSLAPRADSMVLAAALDCAEPILD